MDRLLDEARAGPTYMRSPAVADLVVTAIREAAPGDFDLHTWAVMQNHVHLLITPKIHASVALRRLKGTSARKANQLLGLTGQPFWQNESYDHLVRNRVEFQRITAYILQNPVRAGLAQTEEEYPCSGVWSG